MKTVKVVAAVIKALNKKESQLYLQHSADMENSKTAGNFREVRSKKVKHHKKH